MGLSPTMKTAKLDNKRRAAFPKEFRPGTVFEITVKGLSQVTFTRLRAEKSREELEDAPSNERAVKE